MLLGKIYIFSLFKTHFQRAQGIEHHLYNKQETERKVSRRDISFLDIQFSGSRPGTFHRVME